MRYYFHLKSQNDDIIPDDDGIDIEDSCVRSAVMDALAAIIGQVPQLVDQLSEWKLAVCTSSNEVFSISLDEFSFQRVFETTSAHAAQQAGSAARAA